jgi:tetratricopeptide (TPR) repeat protein
MKPLGLSSLQGRLSALVLAALMAGCGNGAPDLQPVPIPDMSSYEAGVRARLTSARADFERISSNKPSAGALGEAYGRLAMAYHAQSINEAATVAYRDARMLVPGDKRWPYLLGQVYADGGKVPEAIEALEASLTIDPDDAAAKIALARLRLKQGELEQAGATFKSALAVPNARAAALTGLGKVAMAQGKYRDAVESFEQALALAPGASRLRQPLAQAYRALGDTAKATENLRRYTVDGYEPGVPDPLLAELNSKSASYRALMVRAQYAVDNGRLDVAEQIFRDAVRDDPMNVEAIANLGTTLANQGKFEEARKWLEEAVRLDDSSAMAHLNLGLLLDRQGLDDLAIAEYDSAARRNSSDVQARVYQADAKMRTGHPEAAAALYRAALVQSPDSPRIEMSLAMALVRNADFKAAREVLERSLKAQPNNPDLSNALARLLATAKDSAVRDGARSLIIAKALYQALPREPVVAQTYAMALAESGDFPGAIRLQTEVLNNLKNKGPDSIQDFVQGNLAQYRAHKASREGWSAQDPFFQPRSPAARLVNNRP